MHSLVLKDERYLKQHKGGIICEEHPHSSDLKCTGYMFSVVHMHSLVLGFGGMVYM